jgi:small subunit ribosomal protein S10
MVWDADSEVVERWFKYLRRHAMGGVGMRCVKWERMPIGIGQKTEIEVEDALHRSKQISNSVKIKRLGARIVEKEAAAVEKTVTAEQT